MNTKDLLKKEVLDLNANKVGYVADMDFDLKQGSITHIIVQSGVFKKLTISIDQIDKIGDKLTLGITKYDLERTK